MTISLMKYSTNRSPSDVVLSYSFHAGSIWNEMKKDIVDKSVQSTVMQQQQDETRYRHQHIDFVQTPFYPKQIIETPLE